MDGERLLNAVKRLARTLAPDLYASSKGYLTEYGRLTRSIGQDLNWTVEAGPFRGMKYVRSSFGSVLLPKLLGSYELELHPWIDKLATRPFSHVIDIGCAEGYYAVGLARRMPHVAVIGFDLDHDALLQCQKLAELNGVATRVHLRGECSPRTLADMEPANAMVISDCEGGEGTLLDPLLVPWLVDATILVETHEWLRAGVTAELRQRLCGTHEVCSVRASTRDYTAQGVLGRYPAMKRALAMNEFRRSAVQTGGQEWLLMEPFQRGSRRVR